MECLFSERCTENAGRFEVNIFLNRLPLAYNFGEKLDYLLIKELRKRVVTTKDSEACLSSFYKQNPPSTGKFGRQRAQHQILIPYYRIIYFELSKKGIHQFV